jgi:hypothetical protein
MKIKLLPGTVVARVEAATGGYLASKGWFRTRATWRAMDAAGDACPWFTYPAISFLTPRIQSGWSVLEYGSGAGTEWWAQRCSQVLAVEHDAEWGLRVGTRTRASIVMVDSASEEGYVSAARNAAPFDVIVVDGIFRPACLEAAPSLLASRGIIILDDAQRLEYGAAIEALLRQGFRCIPFWGPQPISKHEGCTSIFYRSDNILSI